MAKPNYNTGKTLAILFIGVLLIFLALNAHSEKIDATKSSSGNDFGIDGNSITSANGVSITPDDKNGFVKVNDSADISFEYFATCFFDDLSSKNYSFKGSDKDFIWVADPKTGTLVGTFDKSKEPIDKGKNVADFNVLFKFIPDKENAKFYSSIETDSRCVFTFDYIFKSAKKASYISKAGKQILIDSDVSFDSDILVMDNFRIDLSDISKYSKSMSASNSSGKWEIKARLIFNLEKGKIELDPVINAGTADGYIDYQTSSFAAGNSDNAAITFLVGEQGTTATVGGYDSTAGCGTTLQENGVNVVGWLRATVKVSQSSSQPLTVKCYTGGEYCSTLTGAVGTNCPVNGTVTTCNSTGKEAPFAGNFRCTLNDGGALGNEDGCGSVAASCTGANTIQIAQYGSNARGYLNFDISALSGKKVKNAKLCVYLESQTVDSGACEGTIDLRHIQNFAPLTSADWAYTDIGDVNAAFLQCADTVAKWVCTNVDANIQADITAARTTSAFLLKHSLENEDNQQAYFTITSADAGANKPYLDVNYFESVDANILKIEDYNNEQTFPVFKYATDGNLTIDFNVLTSDENTLRFDVNYSTTPNEGTGTVLYADVNTFASGWCSGADFQKDTNCAVDMNISPDLVADGTYYILIKAKGYAENDFNSSWAAFTVTNTTPPVPPGGGGGTTPETPPVEPPIEPPLVIPLIYENISPPNVDIPVLGDYNAFIKVKRLTYNIISISHFVFDFSSIDYEITNLTGEKVNVYFEFSDEIAPYVMADLSTEYLPLEPNEKKKISIIPSGELLLINSAVGKLTFVSKIGAKESKNQDLINVYSTVGLFEFIAFGSFLFLPTWAWIAIVIVFLGIYLYRRKK